RRINPRQDSRADQKKPTEAMTPEDQSAAATPKTYFVAVLGDAMGDSLADGLKKVLTDKPEIGVLKLSKPDTGLTRTDAYDWTKSAKEIALGQQKIDVAVIFIGAGDRQSFTGNDADEPLSAHWRELYAAKINALTATFKETKIPVSWVGLPVMKNEGFSSYAAKLNEIIKQRATAEGAIFVDLWDALSDEKGQYTAFGPDINGQIVKMRTGDGVYLTPAGGASVAHFVAGEVRKLYEVNHPNAPLTAAAPQSPEANKTSNLAPSASPNTPQSAPPQGPVEFRSPVPPQPSAAPTLPERPAVGPIQSLTSPPDPAGAELAKKSTDPIPAGADEAAKALARHVFVQGGDQPVRKDRADDYGWKP
ncbi:MAG: DUF459 domain-containing protein, partial [Methylocystis sp.]